MRPRELAQYLDSYLEAKDIPSLFCWGAPGIGKSEIIRSAATRHELQLIDLRLILLDPTDLRGVLVPKDGKTVWLPPEFLPTSGRGILVLEELNVAPILVQSSALQLCYYPYRLGEYQLPYPDWKVIATGNRETEAFVHRMSPPLLNRFTHVILEADIDDWTSWAIQKDIRPEVIGFLQFRRELLFKFEASRQERSFPSPRSWVFTSQLLGIIPEALLHEAVAGAVGEGAATEFAAFRRTFGKLPNLDQILDGENIIPEGLDIKYALVSALASKASKAEHYSRLIDYSIILPKEYGVLLGRLLCDKNRQLLTSRPNWIKFAKHFRDIVL